MSDDGTDHLMRLGGTSWGIWKLAALRSAGFAADRVLTIADGEIAAFADAEAKAALPSDAYRKAYQQAWQRASDNLAAVARDPRFREAVTWQNPPAVMNCLDNVARAPDLHDALPASKHRKRLLTMANYLQRYALKNDSIGFFGPVGWAWWTGGDVPLGVTTGEELLTRRTVYFERWAVDAVARVFARDPEMLPHLRPSRSPENLLTDGAVITPSGRRVTLSEPEALILEECDGVRGVAEIAEHVGEGRDAAMRAVAVIQDLRDRGLLVADFRVPPGEHPEEALREQLMALPQSGPRSRALSTLGELTAARDKVASAAGDPEALRVAMAGLHTLFGEITGKPAKRRPGEMYAGRTLVYEDTVRNVEVSLGQPLLEALAAPLELLLESARWFTCEVARVYEKRFHEVFSRICARTGQQQIPLGRLLSAVTPDLVFSFNRLPPLIEHCADELRRKWSRILKIPPGRRRHEATASDIRGEVLREFACPPPRWSGALRHSPDIMIAAESLDAVARGDFRAVLGELHVSANTLEARAFVAQAEDPAWLMNAEAADHAGRRVVSLPSAESNGVNSRTHPSALYGSEFTYWTMFSDVVDLPDDLLPAGGLEVVGRSGPLTVVSKADGREFDLFEMLGEALGWVAMNGFSILASARHRPRVTVDGMVVAREAWRFDSADLDWAGLKDGAERFRAARRWRRKHDMPERCFYSLPTEPKPQFVDFSSVVLVDMFARGIRRAHEMGESVALSEMLPDVNETWLSDHAGRRYTSELRLVAVEGEDHG